MASMADERYSQLEAAGGEEGLHQEEQAALPASASGAAASDLRASRLGSAAAVAFAAALLLAATAAVMAARSAGPVESDHVAAAEPLALFAAPYEDPQGHTVCPATFDNRGQCNCDCAWAQNGGCAARTDDNTCCYSCCCSGAGGGVGAGREDYAYSGQEFEHSGGANYGVQPAPIIVHSGGAIPGMQPAPMAGQVHYLDTAHDSVGSSYPVDDGTHVHQFPSAVHDGVESGYHVGDAVYVKASSGKMVPAVVTDIKPDGQYSIRYLPDHGHGSVSVQGQTTYAGKAVHGRSSAQTWWIILGIVFVALFGLSLYLCFARK